MLPNSMSLQEQNILKVLFHKYEDEERQLIAITSYYCGTFIKDGRLRGTYNANVMAAVKDLRTKMLFGASNVDDFIKEYKNMHNRPRYSHLHGKTAIQILEMAAREASQTRNSIMEIIRLQTSPTMRAWAVKMKQKGHTFEKLLDHYTKDKGFGEKFSEIKNEKYKSIVYMEVFNKAGNPNVNVGSVMKGISIACKGLVVASFAIAIYNIYNAEDKVGEAIKQGTILAGAFAGATLVGEASTVLCVASGPGYGVCVTISTFVGGVVGCFLGDRAHAWIAPN